MAESRTVMIKRLRMRSMRRGIKEMDLILSDFAGTHLDDMSDAGLARYDALLSENDHDIYGWITGQAVEPDVYRDLMNAVRAAAEGVVKPS